MVRNATIHDVPAIATIVNNHAELGRMLFKSYAQLYEALRDFGVYEQDGKVIGCVALTIIWADLAEVKSLAVEPGHMGKGIGKQLVTWTIGEARRMSIRKLMTLTYEQAFFEKCGFHVVEKESLPLKVWSECVKCPKNQNCDEIAMVQELADVPIVKAPESLPTPRGISVPVLPYVVE